MGYTRLFFRANEYLKNFDFCLFTNFLVKSIWDKIILLAMADFLLKVPFSILAVPNLKFKRPGWAHQPEKSTVLFFVILSYFLITGGLIYDMIVEPPSMGSTTDEHGHSRPVAFMQYRINGQYIMEGLAAAFMFVLGGCGFIVLDQTHTANMPKLNRMMLQLIGFGSLILAFFCCNIFMRIKLPGYLLQN